MATARAATHSFSVCSIIRGYHVYQRIWSPYVGEKAMTVREPENEQDHYAVAVLEEETLCTVGHLDIEGVLLFHKKRWSDRC